ncbi:GIY-YIG nuclease family protein [Roseibium sp. CAU 1637]|uniref:GIY-YIG nuclease family protein n=1 Tax=Roseibium limicola TaxID=2816037 RepID=A0A939J5V3_9HYPH|nr:GIY-YIG nuclease family protein [Roseibium limicola]
MSYFVYILANKPHGAIYVGSARNLRNRLKQHQAGMPGSHTAKYNIKTLVYFECHDVALDAIHREHRLKRWKRAWKDRLIEEFNPAWEDMSHFIPFD